MATAIDSSSFEPRQTVASTVIFAAGENFAMLASSWSLAESTCIPAASAAWRRTDRKALRSPSDVSGISKAATVLALSGCGATPHPEINMQISRHAIQRIAERYDQGGRCQCPFLARFNPRSWPVPTSAPGKTCRLAALAQPTGMTRCGRSRRYYDVRMQVRLGQTLHCTRCGGILSRPVDIAVGTEPGVKSPALDPPKPITDLGKAYLSPVPLSRPAVPRHPI